MRVGAVVHLGRVVVDHILHEVPLSLLTPRLLLDVSQVGVQVTLHLFSVEVRQYVELLFEEFGAGNQFVFFEEFGISTNILQELIADLEVCVFD